jgi:lysine-N-methylase
VRVSVAVECACVLASIGSGGGSPLLPAAARVRGDLDPAVHVAELPAQIAVRNGVTAPRADAVAWSRCVARAPAPVDAPAAFWALADAVDAAGLDPGAARRALAPSHRLLTAEALRPWLTALAARTRRRAEEDARWRSERDLARVAVRWLADAAAALLASGALPAAGPDTARSEAFYLRATIHGHQLMAADEPLARALRDRAARLAVARAMALGLAGGIGDRAGAHPLALVEALLRGHGLGAYVHDPP